MRNVALVSSTKQLFDENDCFKKEWLLTYEQKQNIHRNLQSFSELLYNGNDDEKDNGNDDDDDDDVDNNSVIYPRQYL